MKRILPLAVLAAGLAACIVGPAPAQQTPPPAEPARPAPTVRLIEPADLDRPRAPAEPAISFQRAALMDEIQAVLETGRAEVAALEAELDPAAGADAFLALPGAAVTEASVDAFWAVEGVRPWQRELVVPVVTPLL